MDLCFAHFTEQGQGSEWSVRAGHGLVGLSLRWCLSQMLSLQDSATLSVPPPLLSLLWKTFLVHPTKTYCPAWQRTFPCWVQVPTTYGHLLGSKRVERLSRLTRGPNYSGPSFGLVTFQLCDLMQVTHPFCASVPSVKEHNNNSPPIGLV